MYLSKYEITAGMMPQAPFVGAVTTRPPAAFSSLTDMAMALTQSMKIAGFLLIFSATRVLR